MTLQSYWGLNIENQSLMQTVKYNPLKQRFPNGGSQLYAWWVAESFEIYIYFFRYNIFNIRLGTIV